MSFIFLVLGVIFVIWLLCCITTAPERHESDEFIRRERLLFEEKCRAERAKQAARSAGEVTRKNIVELASRN